MIRDYYMYKDGITIIADKFEYSKTIDKIWLYRSNTLIGVLDNKTTLLDYINKDMDGTIFFNILER